MTIRDHVEQKPKKQHLNTLHKLIRGTPEWESF